MPLKRFELLGCLKKKKKKKKALEMEQEEKRSFVVVVAVCFLFFLSSLAKTSLDLVTADMTLNGLSAVLCICFYLT